MKVLDPGHLYELANLDTDDPGNRVERVRFVKRIGEKFPGNKAPGYAGTTTQEVIRALIDRTKYVDAQRPDLANSRALHELRSALVEFEMRAAKERGDVAAAYRIAAMDEPELAPVCHGCGHILCERKHE